MNGFITEPIRLSSEQSKAFCNSLFRPSAEYLSNIGNIFSNLDREISINRTGRDIEIDIPNLDLSFIDEMNCKWELSTVEEVVVKMSISKDSNSFRQERLTKVSKFNRNKMNSHVWNEANLDKQEIHGKHKQEMYEKNKNEMKSCEAGGMALAA